jgi:hypothetical protein
MFLGRSPDTAEAEDLRRFQVQNLVRRKHVGQSARLAHKREVAHHFGTAERDLEVAAVHGIEIASSFSVGSPRV